MVHFLDYQCSLERLDPNKGYIKGNVVLCSLEMNGVSQWTVQKFQQIREQLINSKECFEYLQEIEQAQENTTNHTSKMKQLSRYNNGILEYKCTSCSRREGKNVFFPKYEFLEDKSYECFRCKQARHKTDKNTIRGHLKFMLRGAKHSSQKT